MLVLGAGIVGVSCAWLLQRRGHAVTLLAPDLEPGLAPDRRPEGAADATATASLSGSRAALGVLMGQVFHRQSGRAWRLRQRSLELWQDWRRELEGRGWPVPYRPGLLLLAADAEEGQRLERRLGEAQRLDLPLRWLDPQHLAALAPALPGPCAGGLLSPADGQIDPSAALAALLGDGRAAGLELLGGSARALEARPHGWRVHRAQGDPLEAAWLVLAAGCGSNPLLAGLQGLQGLEQTVPIEPVLGQALELELDEAETPPGDGPPWRSWPGAVVWQGLNLVPRPDLPGGRRFWLGASVEPGEVADPAALASLRELGGHAPAWLRRARVRRHWQGLRPRPLGRPAPLLEQPAPGLLLASGHHRNGVLLAPASAEWVCRQVEQSPTPDTAP